MRRDRIPRSLLDCQVTRRFNTAPPRPGLHRRHPGNAHGLRRQRPDMHAARVRARHRLPRSGLWARARPQRGHDAGDRGPDLPQRPARGLAPDRRGRARQLPVLTDNPRRPADVGLRTCDRGISRDGTCRSRAQVRETYRNRGDHEDARHGAHNQGTAESAVRPPRRAAPTGGRPPPNR